MSMAIFIQAFDELKIVPKLMVRPSRDGGVNHFAYGLQIGCGWRKNQTVPGHAFGDGRVGSSRELGEDPGTETAISFPVAALRQQRGQTVVGVMIRGNQVNHPPEVRNGGGPLSAAPMNDAQHIENADACRIRNLKGDLLRFLILIAALSRIRPE